MATCRRGGSTPDSPIEKAPCPSCLGTRTGTVQRNAKTVHTSPERRERNGAGPPLTSFGARMNGRRAPEEPTNRATPRCHVVFRRTVLQRRTYFGLRTAEERCVGRPLQGRGRCICAPRTGGEAPPATTDDPDGVAEDWLVCRVPGVRRPHPCTHPRKATKPARCASKLPAQRPRDRRGPRRINLSSPQRRDLYMGEGARRGLLACAPARRDLKRVETSWYSYDRSVRVWTHWRLIATAPNPLPCGRGSRATAVNSTTLVPSLFRSSRSRSAARPCVSVAFSRWRRRLSSR